MKRLFTLLAFLLFTQPAFASSPDLSISPSHIYFSEETLYAGATVRLYATVKNYSDTDVTAKVIFYQGAVLIGSSQTVSVLADGGSDDVYVDYEVPRGTFNIRAVIQGQDPDDVNSANNEAITGLFTSVSDDDRDGVRDEDDNCVSDENADQEDMDDDGEGDACDDDRDGDGVGNGSDAYPDDAARSSAPVVESETAPVEESDVPEQAIETSAEELSVNMNLPQNDAGVAGESDNESDNEKKSTTTITSTKPPKPSPGIFGFGTLAISPYAQFSYRQIDWRTYEFVALPSEGQGSVTYAWDFGDGATSVQASIVHAFPDAGQYVVTLAVTDETGAMVSDAQTFDISFFHLHNPWIQATLAALFFILLGLVWFIVRLKEAKEEKEEKREEEGV